MKNNVVIYRLKVLIEIYNEDSQKIMKIYDNADDFLKVVIIDQFISSKLKKDIYERLSNDIVILLKYLMFIGFNIDNIYDNSRKIEMECFFKNNYSNDLFNLYNSKIQNISKDELIRIKKEYIDEIISNAQFFRKVYSSNSRTDIYVTIKSILDNKTISNTTKEEIIEKIINDNDLFQSFSFNSILVNNLWMLTNKTVLKNIDVKLFLSQLFDKMEGKAISKTLLIKNEEEYQTKCSEIIETELRKFLIIFCKSININGYNNSLISIMKSIINHVDNEEYYGDICEFFLDMFSNRKEYCLLLKKIDDIKIKNERIVNQIKEHLVPKELSNCSYDVGLSTFMNKYFEEIITYYLNREEDMIPKEVSIALIICYCNRLKKEFNIDFDVTFLSENVNYYTLGNYYNENRMLYLNPIYIANKKKLLILNFNTIFHEVRHALQMQKLYHRKEFDYTTFLMVIDQYNSRRQNSISDYYDSNYQQISFECDAKYHAYIDTICFFKKYSPYLLNIELGELDNNNNNNNNVYSRVRRDKGLYKSMLIIFIDSLNSHLIFKNTDRDYCDKIINEMNNKFPVLFYAIIYNKDGNYVRFMTKNEIIQLLDRYNNNEEVVNFYQNLLYDLEVANLLVRNKIPNISSSNNESDTLEEVENELNDKVGSYQFVKDRK